LESFREKGDWQEFYGTQLRPIFGSKINEEVIRRSLLRKIEGNQDPSPAEIIDWEIESYIAAAEEGRLEVESKESEPNPRAAIHVLTAIKQTSRILAREGKTREVDWLYAFYAYLSNQCHPSAGSWSYLMPQVVEGGEFVWSAPLKEDFRQMALVAFAQLGSEHVLPLPLDAYRRLSVILAEVVEDIHLFAGPRT
jgi:hypothetical protein